MLSKVGGAPQLLEALGWPVSRPANTAMVNTEKCDLKNAHHVNFRALRPKEALGALPAGNYLANAFLLRWKCMLITSFKWTCNDIKYSFS
jgi:hypothetical protein